MSPQPQPQPLTIPSPPILVRYALARWTDSDLLYVLGHANGNFEMAIHAILRHEATGQPPGDLIHHLSEGEIGPQPQLTRNISSPGCLQSSTHTGPIVRPVGLDDNVSMGTITHPPSSTTFVSERLPPSSTSTFFRFERVPMQLNTLVVRQPDCESRTAIVVPRSRGITQGRGRSTGEYTGESRVVSPSLGPSTSTYSLVNSAISRLLDLDVHRKMTRREKDEILLRRSSHRQPNADANASDSMPNTQKHQQRQRSIPREIDMLNMQTSIEASLKMTTRNTNEIDLEDEAISYAVKVSTETFDEELKRMELRNALEMKQIKNLLVESLSDPVKMSEDELITKAMVESLADPVKMSEDELTSKAMVDSLADPVKMSEDELTSKAMVESLADPVKMSEEELTTKAMVESLADPVKMSEEQLIEEARERSLRDPIKKAEEELVEKAIRQSLFQEMPEEEDLIEDVKCQSLVSLYESTGKKPVEASMPMLSRRWSFTDEDMMFECSIGIDDDSPPSTLDFSLTSSSFFDYKMPARTLTETQAIDNDVIESFGNVDVTLEAPASAKHVTGEEDATAYVIQNVNDLEKLRSQR